MSTRQMQEDMTMNMKVIGTSRMIGYWTTAFIVTLELLAGSVTDLIHGRELLFVGDPVVLVLAQLRYPVYLLTILGVWRLLGAIALLVPRYPRRKRMGICRHLLCLRNGGCIVGGVRWWAW